MFLIIIFSWEFIASFYPSHVFPNLIELAGSVGSLFTASGEFSLLNNVSLTLARIVMSVTITMVLGVLIGVSMGLNEYVESYFRVYVLVSLAVPAVVWALLSATWFGLTRFLVPVFTGVLVLLPYVVINTWEGTKALDTDLTEMAEAFGGNGPLLWYKVFYPQLLPFLLSSLRTVISIGWKIMLVAEIFGSQSGVGFVVNRYFFTQENDMILAWTLPVLAVILVVDRLLRRYEKRQFQWKESGTDVNTAA